MLDDYAFLTHACLDGWLATGSAKYYRAALDLAERMIAEFYDPVGGGFFDATAKGPELLGVLTARRKPLQDSPTPAGNPAAAAALLRLEALNGRADLREKAEDTLEAFAGVVTHFGLYAGTYGLALERLLLPPVQVVVIGEDAAADELEAAATDGLRGEQERDPFDPGAGGARVAALAGRNAAPASRTSRRRTALPWFAGEHPAFRRPRARSSCWLCCRVKGVGVQVPIR